MHWSFQSHAFLGIIGASKRVFIKGNGAEAAIMSTLLRSIKLERHKGIFNVTDLLPANGFSKNRFWVDLEAEALQPSITIELSLLVERNCSQSVTL